MQSLVWKHRRPVPSVDAERTVSKVLILPGDGFCRGRDLPEKRQRQIEEVAHTHGMTLFQALSLRRQILRAKPGGMQRFAASNAMGSQKGQHDVSKLFEECVADALRAEKIQFKTEADLQCEMNLGLRPRGPTPDFAFAPPIYIHSPAGIWEVGWLDCKNFYGSAMMAHCDKIPAGKLNSQASTYSTVYGRGGFVFAQGFCADLYQILPTCLLLDAVPMVDMSRVEAFHDETLERVP